MKEFYQDIEKGQLKPVYMFYGEEAFLMDEAMAALNSTLDVGAGAWNREVFDGESSNPVDVAAAAAESGLFGGRRLVLVKNPVWLGGENDAEAPLLAYLNDPNPNTCLALFYRGSLDKRRKLPKLAQKKGRLIECAIPKEWEKEKWLEARLRSFGLQAQREALAYISLSAANLSQLAAEAEKLRLYCEGQKKITLADAEAVVAQSSLFSIFELTDAAAAKNAAQACEGYRRLLRQGEAEQKIFVMLAGHFRNMLLVQDMLQNGCSAADIAARAQLHPFVVEKCARACRGFSQRQLIAALEMLLAADIAQKSGEGEMAELLEMSILRICAM